MGKLMTLQTKSSCKLNAAVLGAIIFVVVLGVFVGRRTFLASLAQVRSSSQDSNNAGKGSSNPSKNTPPILSIQELDSDPSQEPNNTASKDEGESSRRIMVVYGWLRKICLGLSQQDLLTVCLVIVAVLQWNVSRRQAKIMKTQADILRHQLVVAEKAAVAAMNAVSLAEKGIMFTQRPWIQVSAVVGGPLLFDLNGITMTIKLKITNVGQTPALQVFSNIKAYLPTEKNYNIIVEQQEMAEDTKVAFSVVFRVSGDKNKRGDLLYS